MGGEWGDGLAGEKLFNPFDLERELLILVHLNIEVLCTYLAYVDATRNVGPGKVKSFTGNEKNLPSAFQNYIPRLHVALLICSQTTLKQAQCCLQIQV